MNPEPMHTPTAVRVQAGGAPLTRVVTLADGTPIPGVRRVDITIGIEDVARATIETIMPEVDVVALADILTTTLPNGTRYRLVPMGEGKDVAPDVSRMTVEQFVERSIGNHPNYRGMRGSLVADILAMLDARTRQRDSERNDTVLRCTGGALILNHPLPPPHPGEEADAKVTGEGGGGDGGWGEKHLPD